MIERGTGATTRAMLAAPKNALYLWCNDRSDYPRKLAQFLNRKDLRILTTNTVINHGLKGLQRPLVVDHAFQFTPTMIELADEIRIHIRRYGGSL